MARVQGYFAGGPSPQGAGGGREAKRAVCAAARDAFHHRQDLQGIPQPALAWHDVSARLDILGFNFKSWTPRQAIDISQKWMDDQEFSAERAAEQSCVCEALVLWVQAVVLYYNEQKSRPTGEQIERAIVSGSMRIGKSSNLKLQRMLPEICRNTGKKIGRKTYSDLARSTNWMMRRMFSEKADSRARKVPDGGVKGEHQVAEKDVDLRGSYEHFRKAMMERIDKAEEDGDLRLLFKLPEARLVQLFKFEHKAFHPEITGVRSWDRFDVQVEEGAARRPDSAERNVKTSKALEDMYKSDSLVRRLLKAIEANDGDAIRRIVYAGASLDWQDDKGRSVMDLARDNRKMGSLHALERLQGELREAFPNGGPTGVGGKKKKAANSLPKIHAPRPRSMQVAKRERMEVKKWQRAVEIERAKYSLEDPVPEEFSQSSSGSDDDSEEVDPEVRRADNIARFMYLFNPPLTPLNQPSPS
eukprot:CAMPEP_0172046386 /NCGR_PEP_ID=MMETSP1043-20130122/401_1 /TAXON_ID=464988 /ORGANISM="Hemiselmis andersenii, Strain CCMP441" /LENGTH=471 /DNA_ID=CAMNT_0012705077 /DNA_START=87 /DNA_END=1500 /DNA_ORIENTATION=+